MNAGLSIVTMGGAASFIARLPQKHRRIANSEFGGHSVRCAGDGVAFRRAGGSASDDQGRALPNYERSPEVDRRVTPAPPRICARNTLALLALMIRLDETRMTPMADDTRETENVRFLAGQVHALVGFCVAIINTHPSPADLSQHLEAVEHVTLARVESTLVIEDFLDGVRNVFDRLKTAVANAETRQAGQTAPSEDVKSDWEEAAAAQAIKQRQG